MFALHKITSSTLDISIFNLIEKINGTLFNPRIQLSYKDLCKYDIVDKNFFKFYRFIQIRLYKNNLYHYLVREKRF